jgi:hypothetical protein
MAGPLPGADLKLNENSTHPPFDWSVGIPSDWALVDTAPGTWQRSAEQLIDYKFAGKKLPAAERRTVFGWIEHVVAESQRADTILCVMQFGKLSTGELGSTGVHMFWYDTSPKPAGLDLVRDMLPETANTTLLETPSGPAILTQDRSSLVPPGFRSRVSTQNYQVFLPIKGTNWMVLFSAATAQSELERVTYEVVTAMAHSVLTNTGDETTDTVSSDGDAKNEATAAGESDEFIEIDKPSAPGIARGFGTLVQRRSSGGTDRG